VRTAYPASLSLKGRGTAAKRQGEGVLGRGRTPPDLLELAREARKEMGAAEERLWGRLRAGRLQGWKFRRQMPFARFRPDFTCPKAKLIVEVDGSQHVDDVARDERRTRYFESQGYRVIRFWNNDVLDLTEQVVEAILAALASPLPGANAPVPLPFREREI
jgi:very-short-patch-repair endonuclease